MKKEKTITLKIPVSQLKIRFFILLIILAMFSFVLIKQVWWILVEDIPWQVFNTSLFISLFFVIFITIIIIRWYKKFGKRVFKC